VVSRYAVPFVFVLALAACDGSVQVEDGADGFVGAGAGSSTDVPESLTCEQFCAERTARWGCTDYPCLDACAPELQQGLADLGCLENAERFYACVIRTGNSCNDGCIEGTLGLDYNDCLTEVVDMLKSSSSATTGAGGGG
jgi:hypothetical protein